MVRVGGLLAAMYMLYMHVQIVLRGLVQYYYLCHSLEYCVLCYYSLTITARFFILEQPCQ
jgi:hypothetical protein